jgi:ActR/RegA family two-component response regulator
MSATKILFVDDDQGVLRSLEAVLKFSGFEVSAVSSVPEALELISKQQFDVLLSDLNIGQPGDGFTVVSAMRRVQPHACTFILTGYPDIESAIQAIRSQVDDYFAKPLKVAELLSAISATQSGKQKPKKSATPRRVSALVRESIPAICERWVEKVLKDPELAALPLSRREKVDHIPDLIVDMVKQIEEQSEELSESRTDTARKHGRIRFQQGYTIPQILFETRVLQRVLSSLIQENLLTIELSTLVHDTQEIGQILQAEVEVSIRAYQLQIPRSLQTSFSVLYQSPYLGVAIADEHNIIDANDALLRMICCTRDQLVAGEIDWLEMTPEKFRTLDMNALQQLREFGTCAPFEKEFNLPDGRTLPFLIGAVRLSLEPFQWSAYLVNLTEQRAVQTAEQRAREWESRHRLINHLAHEINNPLAALIFTFHLLRSHPDFSADTQNLLIDATEMLDRIATAVRKVLIESQQ